MSEEKRTENNGNLNNENENNAKSHADNGAGNMKNEQPVTPADYTGPGYEEAETAFSAAAEQPADSRSVGDGVTPEEPEKAPEPEKSRGRFFRSRREEREFSREEWILTHIGDENLMEYLELEQKREELMQKTKEARQKRILSAFQLAVSLAAVVGIIWLLRDNPTVMVNILYIIGIVGALWIWKNPKSK